MTAADAARSTDTAPYAPQREVEDIAALINEVGEPVYLYGHSSGAALVLNAAIKLRQTGQEAGNLRSAVFFGCRRKESRQGVRRTAQESAGVWTQRECGGFVRQKRGSVRQAGSGYEAPAYVERLGSPGPDPGV